MERAADGAASDDDDGLSTTAGEPSGMDDSVLELRGCNDEPRADCAR